MGHVSFDLARNDSLALVAEVVLTPISSFVTPLVRPEIAGRQCFPEAISDAIAPGSPPSERLALGPVPNGPRSPPADRVEPAPRDCVGRSILRPHLARPRTGRPTSDHAHSRAAPSNRPARPRLFVVVDSTRSLSSLPPTTLSRIGCHCWLVQQCKLADTITAGQASSGTTIVWIEITAFTEIAQRSRASGMITYE
jgi:hypothetical protein